MRAATPTAGRVQGRAERSVCSVPGTSSRTNGDAFQSAARAFMLKRYTGSCTEFAEDAKIIAQLVNSLGGDASGVKKASAC